MALWASTNGVPSAGTVLMRSGQPNTDCMVVVGQDLVHGAAAARPPGLHQDDLIGEQCRQVEIVHHGDDAAAGVAERAGKAHDGQLVADVEAGDRLVEQQPARRAIDDGSEIWQRTRASCTRCCSPPDRCW
jgi:hypothetical protein